VSGTGPGAIRHDGSVGGWGYEGHGGEGKGDEGHFVVKAESSIWGFTLWMNWTVMI